MRGVPPSLGDAVLKAYVIGADEEPVIARETASCVAQSKSALRG